MESEIKWTLDDKVYFSPTAADALEYANNLLSNEDEFECSINDARMKNIPFVKSLINMMKNKGE